MADQNPHKVRDCSKPPDALSLMQHNGQFTLVVAFRKGRPREWYIRFRQWCWANNVNPSDVFNAIIEPITHFCENFATRDGDAIVVPLNLGSVRLEEYYGAQSRGRGRRPYAKKPSAGKKYPRIKAIHLI